jgi:RNA polymerase sigma-70 factor, ECF subfamily
MTWRRGLPDAMPAGEGGITTEPARRGTYESLAQQHLDAMLRVAAALVGPADAEDATQEAVTRGWLAWASLREVGALRSWLLRITVNVCRQWQRGRYGTERRLTEPLREGDTPFYATLDADPGASDHTGALDVRRAVNALDDDLRVIVVLRYYGGMDATEIGRALGLPPPTVRTRLRRALRVLREQLNDTDTPAAPRQKGSADV